MEVSQLKAGINSAFEELAEVELSFSDQDFNRIPFEGSWTPGQLGRHVAMVSRGFTTLLFGPDSETKRPEDEKTEMMRDDFENFDKKTKAGENVTPQEREYDRDKMLADLAEISKEVSEAVSSGDISKICTLFEIPVYGYLTRLEAAYFVILHTRRHIHQLREIRKHFN